MDSENQLKEIYELQDRMTRGVITHKEMREILDGFVALIGEVKKEITENMAKNKDISDSDISEINQKIDDIEAGLRKVLAENSKKSAVDIKDIKQHLLEKINEVEGLIPAETDLSEIWDKLSEIEKKIPKIPEPKIETPDEVVKKINNSKEQIDASKIKNLPAPVYETRWVGGGSGVKKVKAGTNITVTDTGNGEVTINSTATGEGSGDVVGPSSAVDSNFAAFNTTTGKLIKDSGKKAADFAPALGADDNYVTDAEKVVIGNTSGTNTGDQDLSGLALKATTLTINGTTYDLSANRSWTVSGEGSAGITRSVVVTTGNVTAGNTALTDYVYLVAGAHTITMPTAVSNTNRYTIKNNHSSAITVNCTGAETIDGAASLSLGVEEAIDLISNGTVWNII